METKEREPGGHVVIIFGERALGDVVSNEGEPTDLSHLEELCRRSVKLMEKHRTKTVQNYFKAMDLLREQYNLNFIVLCEKCGGTHLNDELLAPER